MGKPALTILDSIHTKANSAARELILPALEYEDVHWRRSRFGGKNCVSKRYLITGRSKTSGTFLTGLVPRILSYADRSGFFLSVRDGNIEVIKPTRQFPKLKGITFRPDQKRALRAIRRNQRGIIKFPTGTGKTIIALGAFSMYENSPRLFLCHTKDLLLQTAEEISLLPTQPQLIVLGGGYKPDFSSIKKLKNPIVVSTIQTFSKYHPHEWCDYFDFTIVDECHNANNRSSQYGKVMEYNLSPMRVGISATPPTSGKKMLTCEGFFGPIIAELGMEKGIKKGIIAKPVINLISVPEEAEVKTKFNRSYRTCYEQGIIYNETRNRMIVDLAVSSIKKKEIVLIIIENTIHGEILQKMLKQKSLQIPFVQGSTLKEDRESVKNRLKSKKLAGAICSKVWREGVNIPSLNHIINAHGMKAEKIIIQAMGRGLRTADGKDLIKLSDFLDPYNYLAQHAIQRIQIYKEQGWM